MLYLSLLMVNGRSREARGDLGNCAALHRRVLHAFPNEVEVAARERFGVLYRVEPVDGGARILVQSRELPDWSRLPAGYLRRDAVAATKRIDEAYAQIATGDELVFRLRANPTRRIDHHNMTVEERWRGKRVDIRGEAAQTVWLRRQAEKSGFALLTVRSRTDGPEAEPVPDVRTVQVAGRVTGGKRDRQMTFGSVVFEGRLRVTDAAAFRRALEVGIGSGKAFGFGLLSVIPVPRE